MDVDYEHDDWFKLLGFTSNCGGKLKCQYQKCRGGQDGAKNHFYRGGFVLSPPIVAKEENIPAFF